MSTRVKSGCITCRIRRVKCDEGKPQCQRCLSSKRVCDGYLSPEENMSRRQLAAAVRNLSVIGPVSRTLGRRLASAGPLSILPSEREVAYFDLFRSVAIPSTTALFPSAFWGGHVLQIAESEPAVWHGVIALGIMHHCAEAMPTNPGDRGKLISQADKSYGKAMSLCGEPNSAVKLATLSIVLGTAANMLGRWAEAQRHILAGLSIVSKDNRQSPALKPHQGILPRTELPVMAFGEASSPYPFKQSTEASPPKAVSTLDTPQDASYENLASEFFDIARAYCLIDERLVETEMTYGPWLTRTQILLRRLGVWETHMTNFEASAISDKPGSLTKLSLRMFHATLRLLLKATPFGPETRYDALLGICEYIVRLAATISTVLKRNDPSNGSASFEPGVVLPLWVVTHRCRHTGLRHAALNVLAGLRRTEGIWNSDLATSIMAQVLAIEEQHVDVSCIEPYDVVLVEPLETLIPLTAWQSANFEITPTLNWNSVPFIPENVRVKHIMGMQDLYRRSIRLTVFTAPTGNGQGYGSMREIEVSF